MREIRDAVEFKNIRRIMSANSADLIRASLALPRADPTIPLLTRPGWIPAAPIPLDDVPLEWRQHPDADRAEEARSWLTHYWPGSTYSEMVRNLERPSHFFNGLSYRLVEADPVLTFTATRYWDQFDTGEALQFEAAKEWHRSGTIEGPYRRWLADPFDLSRRYAIPGVNALTIRNADTPTFQLMNRRRVAVAMGTTHVVPAGDFQPSQDYDPRPDQELRLRNTMIREYAEELLGAHEDRTTPVDITRDAPHAAIYQTFASGAASAWYLGIGLSPLTWKPEILIACVFDVPAFDQLFAGISTETAEGELLNDLPFEEETIRHYATSPSTLPAAQACLTLAWDHRKLIT
ncbi:hypothetical protein GCM10010160_08720 [Acrocarpospora corrugata]